jgi:hypothetical protein
LCQIWIKTERAPLERLIAREAPAFHSIYRPRGCRAADNHTHTRINEREWAEFCCDAFKKCPFVCPALVNGLDRRAAGRPETRWMASSTFCTSRFVMELPAPPPLAFRRRAERRKHCFDSAKCINPRRNQYRYTIEHTLHTHAT